MSQRTRRPPWLVRNHTWLIAPCIVVYFAPVGRSQEGDYLTLRGPGTASVFWVKNNPTAYITDGGRGTNLLDPVVPKEGDRGILADLRGKGVENLVITCSHPHADHREGLVRMIERDPTIFRFRRIYFVESDYPAKETLAQVYDRARAAFLANNKPDPKTLPVVRTFSATNEDALGVVARAIGIPDNAPLLVNNFRYRPAANDPNPHGRSIVTQYVLRQNKQECRVVDFDDAADELIAKWANWAKGEHWKPDVVVLPHHGSRRSNIGPLLAAEIRPRSFIVTVNPHNQYLHPGAETLLTCLREVGRENVHFTGAQDNVHITASGVDAIREGEHHARTYDLIVHPQLVHDETRLFLVEQELLRSPNDLKMLQERGDLLRRVEALRQVRSILTRPPEDRPPPPPLVVTPRPTGPPGRPPGSGRPGVGGPVGPNPNDGGYGPRARQVEKGLGPIVPRGAIRRLRQLHPGGAWGGVALGNPPESSPPVTAAAFSIDGDRPRLIVQIQGQMGDFEFKEMTATELWAAYHMLRPTKAMRAAQVAAGDVGLVGMKKTLQDNSWEFYVHPAIADTLLARQAMRLDMVLALRNARLSALPPHFFTYLWYDETPVISARHKTIFVTAAKPPSDCLLRVDLWGEKTRIDFDTRTIVSQLAERFDALRSIDRFARILAVLNWLATYNKLPELPSSVQPTKLNIPNRWYARDVLGDMALAVPREGVRISGAITANDEKVPLGPITTLAKPLEAKFVAMKQYLLEMDSADFDSIVAVLGDKAGIIAMDNGSAGKQAARLSLPILQNGTYTILTASLKRTGKFNLKITDEGAVQARDVGAGLMINGELKRGLNRSASYVINLTKDKTYVINMISADQKQLDPFLELRDSSGKLLADDDDGGGGLNARIEIRAPTTGVFQVVATCFGNADSGQFRLEIREK